MDNYGFAQSAVWQNLTQSPRNKAHKKSNYLKKKKKNLFTGCHKKNIDRDLSDEAQKALGMKLGKRQAVARKWEVGVGWHWISIYYLD